MNRERRDRIALKLLNGEHTPEAMREARKKVDEWEIIARGYADENEKCWRVKDPDVIDLATKRDKHHG
jgi:hypothetical protein